MHGDPGRIRPLAPALLLATALAGGPATASDITTPSVSGLARRSGSTGGGFPCLARLRGRQLDAFHAFLTHQSFPALVSNAAGLAGAARQAPLLVVSLPLLTSNTHGQFAQCAAGAFDSYFRQIGLNLQRPAPSRSWRGSAGRRTPAAATGGSPALRRSRPTSRAGAAPPRRSRPAGPAS